MFALCAAVKRVTMPNQEIDYLILVHANSENKACEQVMHFLTTTDLINYDRFDILQAGCMDASHQQFWVNHQTEVS